MKTLAEAAELIISATDMERWKDLTSRLVVSYLSKPEMLADNEASEVENFHWYMTKFFNDLKEIQQSERGVKL